MRRDCEIGLYNRICDTVEYVGSVERDMTV